MIKAVIWDMGGVILHMADETPRQALADRWGVPLDDIYQLVFHSETARLAAIGEIALPMHWEALRQAINLPAQELPGFLQAFWSADDVDRELLQYIAGLRPRYQIGLLSNAWEDLRSNLEHKWKINHLFDIVICSAEVGLLKPDEQIYHLAVQRLGIQPGEAIFLDDLLENVDAAERAGLQAIHYLGSETLVELDHLLAADAG